MLPCATGQQCLPKVKSQAYVFSRFFNTHDIVHCTICMAGMQNRYYSKAHSSFTFWSTNRELDRWFHNFGEATPPPRLIRQTAGDTPPPKFPANPKRHPPDLLPRRVLSFGAFGKPLVRLASIFKFPDSHYQALLPPHFRQICKFALTNSNAMQNVHCCNAKRALLFWADEEYIGFNGR